ncbi:protein SPIRRIG, partial [Tanacetum coccineum]
MNLPRNSMLDTTISGSVKQESAFKIMAKSFSKRWQNVLADYNSEELDLTDDKTFCKLDKPMGCQIEEGEDEFKKSTENQTLQGGQFDHADRLFNSVRNTWSSAAGRGNTSDVKELIPEFFYMPEFLENRFGLDLGEKQSGEKVGDVVLPPWAKGSAREFIKKHKEALESDYGSVDIDAVIDPAMKASILAQINHFGQTPKQLFQRAHAKRKKDKKIPIKPLKYSGYLVPHEIRKSASAIAQIITSNDKILMISLFLPMKTFMVATRSASHDGQLLVTGANDGLVCVWRVGSYSFSCAPRTLQLEKALSAHRAKITYLLLKDMDQDSAYMVAAYKVPMLKPVIENGATLPKTIIVEGVVIVMPITTAKEKAKRRLEVKARSTLMMGIPNEHRLKFNSIKDANKLLEAVKKRFEMFDQTFDRLQKLVSQLELLGEKLSQEDVYEPEVKGMSSSSLGTQNMAFVSSSNNNTSSSNEAVNTSHRVTIASTQVNTAYSTNIDNLSDSSKKSRQQEKESSRRSVPVETSTSIDLVSCDGLGGYDWSNQAEEGPNYALMAYSSSISDSEVSNDLNYSDYAGASLDRKSTIGGCQFLGKRLISWQCKKQTIVANSTTKAEYVAAANCYGQ